MMNLAALSTLVLYLASGATATSIEKDASNDSSSKTNRSLRGAPNSPSFHAGKAEILEAIMKLEDAPNTDEGSVTCEEICDLVFGATSKGDTCRAGCPPVEAASFVENQASLSGSDITACIQQCGRDTRTIVDQFDCIDERCFNSDAASALSQKFVEDSPVSLQSAEAIEQDDDFTRPLTCQEKCELAHVFANSARRNCLEECPTTDLETTGESFETYLKSAAPGSGDFLLHCFLSCQAERNVADCLNRRCLGSETSFVDDGEDAFVKYNPVSLSGSDITACIQQCGRDTRTMVDQFECIDERCFNSDATSALSQQL